MPGFPWGRNQSLHYRLFSSYVCILILIKLIDKVTDSSTVNHKLMPSSEEIIFKTVVASAGYFKGLIDERKYLLNFNQSIFSNHLDREVVNNAKKVKIVFIENENTFSKSEWNDLYSLSKETFVDESEELKKTAAGAGLTDND